MAPEPHTCLYVALDELCGDAAMVDQMLCDFISLLRDSGHPYVASGALVYTLVLVVDYGRDDGDDLVRDVSVHALPDEMCRCVRESLYIDNDDSRLGDWRRCELLVHVGHVRDYPPPMSLLADLGVASPHYWYTLIDVDGECTANGGVRVADVLRALYTDAGAQLLFHELVPRWRRLAFEQLGVIEDPTCRSVEWAPGARPRRSSASKRQRSSYFEQPDDAGAAVLFSNVSLASCKRRIVAGDEQPEPLS